MSLFFLQMRNELHKLFARKRTYLGFAAFVAVEILLLLLLNLPKPKAGFRKLIEQNGYGFDSISPAPPWACSCSCGRPFCWARFILRW